MRVRQACLCASGATTCHRQPGCSGPSQSRCSRACYPGQGSFECWRRCSRYHRHRWHCVASGESHEDFDRMDCRTGLFGRGGRSPEIAENLHCFAAAVNLASRSCQIDPVAVSIVSYHQPC